MTLIQKSCRLCFQPWLPVTWACKKQQAIALSSTEAGSNNNCKSGSLYSTDPFKVWFQQQHLTILWCDNQSAIKLAKDCYPQFWSL
jgi:hypothetical protein